MKRRLGLAIAVLLVAAAPAPAQQGYQKPPKVITDILDAPPTPTVSLSPTRERLLLAEGLQYPPIADLAEPMLRLAGLRINPNTNGPHRQPRIVALTLKTVAGGAEKKISLPASPYLGTPSWSPDGKHFAFTNTTASGIELWIGDAASGAVRRLAGVTLNAAYGAPFEWMPDSRTLLCRTLAAGRGKPPTAPRIPTGPTIQESAGKPAPVRTYQDVLQNAHDEALFEYYATSQLAFVNASDGRVTPIGKPGIYDGVEPSPNGEHLLVEINHKPYSYLLPANAFPKEVEVWDRAGKVEHKLASLPLAENVPIDGVPTGPRLYAWRPTAPATLVWAEALDGGDPKQKVGHRDRVLMLAAPFAGQPREVAKTEHRYGGLTWGEKDGVAFLRDFDRKTRWIRAFLLNVDEPGQAPRLVWNRSAQDRYKDPGAPVMRT
ncbi:MAG TPA: S9 family peptidase, partial [Blastocatellia bacterium]|nr:S9 family peptidase [Blastocatellia bacterium]